MLKAAVETLNADKGLFVATNGQYLKRKTVKIGDAFYLTEDERREIIERACEGEEKLSFAMLEMSGIGAVYEKTRRRIFGVMAYVVHKTLGIGTVVKRESCKDGKFFEVSEGGSYLTVRFDNGKETKFAIPASFKNGVISARGSLEDEVNEAASELERGREADRTKSGLSDGTRPTNEKDSRSAKKIVKITLAGNVEDDFKTYLEAAGYEQNVVYAYSRAAKMVCKEENISLKAGLNSIHTIIKKYDKDGEKEELGNYQNKTVINALRRFKEFGDANSDARL